MLAVATVFAAATSPASAAGMWDNVKDFVRVWLAPDVVAAAQTGEDANRLRDIAAKVNLPPGFRIGLFAVVPHARHLAVGSDGTVFATTRKNRVWILADRDNDGVADFAHAFAPDVEFERPSGVCLSEDGALFVGELNRVWGFPDALAEGGDAASGAYVVAAQLIPPEEESFIHASRVCRVGADGKIYISLGQPHNVSPPDKLALYDEVGIGGIIRMNRDGGDREVVARGIRNSVGMDFHPATGELWFTDNQVDGMGDDIPPEELNRLSTDGAHFGFPWFGGGDVRTELYAESEPPAGVVFPEAEMDAHAANLGMSFYSGEMFPAKYRGGIFNAQHGSWNRTEPIGARVMFTPLEADGGAGAPEVFADGWLDSGSGEYLGRPVDVAQLADGSILVSDDRAGGIYRIWFEGE